MIFRISLTLAMVSFIAGAIWAKDGNPILGWMSIIVIICAVLILIWGM